MNTTTPQPATPAQTERLAPLLSRERQIAIAARGRAELRLRIARVRGNNVSWGPKPFFYTGTPVIRAPGRFEIGERCRFRAGPVKTRLITGEAGQIVLGDWIGISYGVEVYAAQSVTIGDGTIIGALVTVYDTGFHSVDEGAPAKTAPVQIGTNVWIGRQATILAGVTVGDHSVVAAGALVARDVPPRTLVGGNPAKPIREIQASDGWRRT